MTEKQKILDLLDSGQISAADAAKLIKSLVALSYNPEEQKRILNLLSEKHISVDQAAALFNALTESEVPVLAGSAKPAKKGVAKLIRISIDAQDENGGNKAKINVNVPLGLAKFAAKFVPQQARDQLDLQGIDLSDLFDSLGSDVPEGRLIDIDAQDDNGGSKAKIIIEVV